MGLLSLAGRITLNGAPFFGTAKDVEKTADKLSNKLRNQVGGIAGGFLGVNALKQVAVQGMESANTITQLSNRFNMTTSEVQLLQKEADRTGESFESLVKNADDLEATLSRLRGGDVIFDPQAVESLTNALEILKTFKGAAAQRIAGILGAQEGAKLTPRQIEFLEKDAAKKRARAGADEQAQKDAEAHMATQDRILKLDGEIEDARDKAAEAGMTKEEKLNRLLEKRSQLFDEISKKPFAPGSETMLTDELRMLKLDAAIAGLRNESVNKPEKVRQPGILSDSLTSVGNFLGANPNSQLNREMTEANKLLRKIEMNTSKTNGGGWPL